jgi:hypothetical protein
MELKTEDSCPDCDREFCWGGAVCSEIKKEKEENE